MDRYDTRQLNIATALNAAKYRNVARRARTLIDRGLDDPHVRRHCLQSPSLFSILESALFARAARRGRLELGFDWSRYGR